MRLGALAIAFWGAGFLNAVGQGTSAQAAEGNSASTSSKITIVSVFLQEQTFGKPRLLEGRLYRLPGPGLKRQHVADVDINGTIRPSVDCESSEKLDADVKVDLMMKQDGPYFCKDTLTFRFKSFDWASMKLPGSSIEITTSRELVAAEKWGEAAYKFNDLGATLRKADKRSLALPFENAAIAAAAKALGDKNLDRFVITDPAQNWRLVFSEEGVAELRKLQNENNFKETGKFDFPTARYLGTK